MKEKICLVTRASSGIGKVAALELAKILKKLNTIKGSRLEFY